MPTGRSPGLEGLSLRLADWKGYPKHRWPGRQVIAVLGGAAVGHLEYFLHPDGEAVEVSFLEVDPAVRGNRLASMLIDTLYEAHPAAWVNHGYRMPDGIK